MPSERASRISQLLTTFGLAYSAFAMKCGMSPSNLKKMIDGEQTVTDKTLHRIAVAYPNVRIDWLKTGEGEMLKEEQPLVVGQAGVVSAVSSVDRHMVPLLPVEAMAGPLIGVSDGLLLENCRKLKCPVAGADLAILISGDSMEPKLMNGMIIYIKKMTGNFIPWGQTLLLDTMDGAVVKNIYPVEGRDDVIEARSINPNYPPFKIESSCILGVYRVLGGSFINSTI